MGPVERIVMAAGAGFHEEVVFRVGLFAGGAWLLGRVSKLPKIALAWIAAIVSSIVFSLIHYLGPLEFTFASFVFRTLAGGFLAALYRARGFAVAVYTHTLYDLMVFFAL
jgi:membrane protease YdiL (CAAX protease family)